MFNPYLIYPNRVRVIVEKQYDDLWVASVPGVPSIGAPAKHPFSAINSLIDRSGDPDLTIDALRPVEGQMTNDHWEFEIQRKNWRPAVLTN